MSQQILVVDDEANIRELYKQELEEEGYAVQTAGSAEEAKQCCERSRPDLMILDIEMAGQDGLSYLRELMESDRHLPVLISSAYSSYREDFSSWLAEAYLVKSSDLDPLKRKVRELLATAGSEIST